MKRSEILIPSQYSAGLPNWFRKLKIDWSIKAVMADLIDRLGTKDNKAKGNYCYPKIVLISDSTGISIPVVSKAIFILENAGWLRISRKSNYPNRYYVELPPDELDGLNSFKELKRVDILDSFKGFKRANLRSLNDLFKELNATHLRSIGPKHTELHTELPTELITTAHTTRAEAEPQKDLLESPTIVIRQKQDKEEGKKDMTLTTHQISIASTLQQELKNLNIELKLEEIVPLLQYWGKKGHKLTIQNITTIINKLKNQPKELDIKKYLFDKVSINGSGATGPGWKKILTHQASAADEHKSLEVPLKVIQAWMDVGLNHVKNPEHVARKIEFPVSRIVSRVGSEFLETIVPAALERRTNGFRLDNLKCQSIEWLFESNEVNGEEVYNIERLARGDYNWVDRKEKSGLAAMHLSSTGLAQGNVNL